MGGFGEFIISEVDNTVPQSLFSGERAKSCINTLYTKNNLCYYYKNAGLCLLQNYKQANQS